MRRKGMTWYEHEKELFAQGRISEEELMIEKLKMDFSCLLYDLRNRQKLTQKELAKRIHVRQQYIAKIETGEENLTLETIGKILIALKSMLKVNVIKKQGPLTDIFQITA